MLLHRLAETVLVHFQAALAGDIAADFERQAVGGVEIEGAPAVKPGGVLGGNLRQERFEPGHAGVDSALEASSSSVMVRSMADWLRTSSG